MSFVKAMVALSGVVLALFIAGALVRALRLQTVPVRGGEARRAEHPISFWITVILLATTSVVIGTYSLVELVMQTRDIRLDFGREASSLCEIDTASLVALRGRAEITPLVLADPHHGSIVYDDRCPGPAFELMEPESAPKGVGEFLDAGRAGRVPRLFRVSGEARFRPAVEENDRPELRRARIELLRVHAFEGIEMPVAERPDDSEAGRRLVEMNDEIP